MTKIRSFPDIDLQQNAFTALIDCARFLYICVNISTQFRRAPKSEGLLYVYFKKGALNTHVMFYNWKHFQQNYFYFFKLHGLRK